MPRKKQVDLPRILETAIPLANAHGIDALTLAPIAEQLGIRIPSLYNHINGLPGLRYQLALWGLRELTDRLRRAAVGKTRGDAVMSIAHSYRAFVHEHPGIYPLTVRAPAPDEIELAAQAKELVEIVFAVLASFDLPPDEFVHATRGLRSLIHGFATLESAGGFALAEDKDESYNRLVRWFIQGLV